MSAPSDLEGVDLRHADQRRSDRKVSGAWYTPTDLVDVVADAALESWELLDPVPTNRAIRIVDPACGDGRFLVAAASRLCSAGCRVDAVGVDIDADAIAATRAALLPLAVDGDDTGTTGRVSIDLVHADALTLDWSDMGTFDLVIGNPPFLSQMATATTRGGSSGRGGGPYADAAVEFLALAGEVVDQTTGRVAYVLPQSLLSARDARPVRVSFDERANLRWSWWTGERVFDANVLTCALLFEFGRSPSDGEPLPDGQRQSGPTSGEWSHVVTRRSGVPDLPRSIAANGTLAERCRLNANFRDEYYGMVAAVGDHASGPRLVTSGLIDPGRCLWGERPVTFAKQRFDRPRLDLAALEGRMTTWAADRLVPKVLIANQTRILEAVADPEGSTLPGVPVVAAYPTGPDVVTTAWEIAAVLTSPFASAWAWHRSAGTGLSADAIRVGPVVLGDLPWPQGDLAAATEALRADDVRQCAVEVHRAYGCESEGGLFAWWETALAKIEARQPTEVTPAPRHD